MVGRLRLPYLVVLQVYVMAVVVLILRDVARIAVAGAWRPGGGALVARRADLVMIGGALVGVAGFLPVLFVGGGFGRSAWVLGLELVVATSFAVPFAVRLLGDIARSVANAAALLAAIAAVYALALSLHTRLAGGAYAILVDASAVVVLAAVLGPGQTWLRGAIDRVVFGRTRRRQAELQAFLRTLSPDLGVEECCRRAIAELVQVMELRGAAVLLDEGCVVAHGGGSFGPLLEVWPRGPAAAVLPPGVLGPYELRGLPAALSAAAVETDVALVVPVTSPHRHWGHLFCSTGLLRGVLKDDVHALATFADQLGLLCAGADLLARAVAVERSLAHAEKLAAIGELAARVAHEIRNPVTAARSLAQQLARGSDPEAAALIVAELDRVERQVAALLRFARRDEVRREPVDLGGLVDETLAAFRARGVGAALCRSGTRGVVVYADREQIRQVLVNLVDNALEAGAQAITAAVGSRNGTATIELADDGAGVPPEALGRLFEPFFSTKPTGTGLGLAIARRAVEAHGGRITVASTPGAGTTFHIALPLGEKGG
jgi:signal transduction histidine kinase